MRWHTVCSFLKNNLYCSTSPRDTRPRRRARLTSAGVPVTRGHAPRASLGLPSAVYRSLLLLGDDKNYNNNRKEKKKREEENAVAHGLLFFKK